MTEASEEFAQKYEDTYWEVPKLHRSCMGDDFQHYTVPSVISKYEKDGVALLPSCRWILKHVLDIGYAAEQEVIEFDQYLLSKYGGGRGRPDWAERVGKKYQWIALYRLAARLALDYPNRLRNHDVPSKRKPLLVEDERNIDPSLLEKGTARSQRVSTWWSPVVYRHTDPKLLDDKEWISKVDFPDGPRMFLPNDEWVALYANFSWERKDSNSKEGYPKRQVWMHLRSLVVKNVDVKKCWHWIQGQDFMKDWMPRGFNLHYGFFWRVSMGDTL